MPSHSYWRIPGRVLTQVVSGNFTLEEMRALGLETTAMMLKDGIAPVHNIVDVSDLRQFPNVNDLRKFVWINKHGKLGWFVVVSTRPLLRFLATTMVMLTHSRLHFAATMEEAETFLAAQDSTLSFCDAPPM